jgi:hypothetical protein
MNRDTVDVVQGEKAREKRKETKQAGGQTLIRRPKKTAHAQRKARPRPKVRRRSHTTRSHVRRRDGGRMSWARHATPMSPTPPAPCPSRVGTSIRDDGDLSARPHAPAWPARNRSRPSMMQFEWDAAMRTLPVCARRSCRVWSEGEEPSGDSWSGERDPET